jgi:FkbM family methyltransferase
VARWWERLRGASLETLRRWVWAPRPVPLKYGGCRIWVLATSDLERRYRVKNPDKEPWTIEWLESSVHSGEVLYDIGANVGVFSLIGARARGARVVAFEPGSANYARLCENIHLNDCAGLITPLPWLLSDREGMYTFTYRSTEPGQSRHQMTVAGTGTPVSPEDVWQSMVGIALDAAVERFGLPAPHHLKLDVDGAEALVLTGAAATLRGAQLRSVLVEASATTGDQVTALLGQAGLRLVKTAARDKPGAPWYGVFERSPALS